MDDKYTIQEVRNMICKFADQINEYQYLDAAYGIRAVQEFLSSIQEQKMHSSDQSDSSANKGEKSMNKKQISPRKHERRFQVMHQTGEYDWEMSCGPYKTYEDAEKSRLGWFAKDKIPHMRVVQFFSPNI